MRGFFYDFVLVNRIMNTELGEFHRGDAEGAEFSDYFSALSVIHVKLFTISLATTIFL